MPGDSQRSVLERLLRESKDGVSVHTLIYRYGITRAAAIVKVLRDEGWSIETEGGQGELATYRLRSHPEPQRRPTRDLTPAERDFKAFFTPEPLPLPPPAPLPLPCGCVRAASGREWEARCPAHAA